MSPKSLARCAAGLIALALVLTRAGTAHAQTVLVSATPAPDSVVEASPPEVRLVFSHPLLDAGTTISVTNEAGQRVDSGDGHVDPADRYALVVSLPVLVEGRYTVSYQASGVGSSTLTIASYSFVLDLPAPVLRVTSPHDGDAFPVGPVTIQMEAEYVDFSVYNTRIHLYVDGERVAVLREWSYSVEGLEPGVHEIRAVLAQFEDQELPEAEVVLYIAIARPDVEMIGRAEAAEAPGDPGLLLTPLQFAGVVFAVTGLMVIGVWLGRFGEGRKRPN